MNKDKVTVDSYISAFPKEVKARLQSIRKTIKVVCPDAEESFGYGVPAFRLNNKPLIYYAAFKNHIGIYPIPIGTATFNNKIKPYIAGKGTLKFSHDKALPLSLIKEVVKFSKKSEIN